MVTRASSSTSVLGNVPSLAANLQNKEPLQRGLSAAKLVFDPHLFPSYRSEQVDKMPNEIERYIVRLIKPIYDFANRVQDVVSYVAYTVHLVVSTVYHYTLGITLTPLALAGYNRLNRPLDGVINTLYPINPVTKERHFVGISRRVEKFIGDKIYYPLVMAEMSVNSHFYKRNSDQSIDSRVNAVTASLVTANSAVLNPPSEATHFDYRVRTIYSPQINAFALPGGGMAIFSELVEFANRSIERNLIRETTIEFDDGSSVKVDLTEVTLNDVLAGVIGHEMTHVAARHSFAQKFAYILNSTAIRLGSNLITSLVAAFDSTYQKLLSKQKDSIKLNEMEQNQLEVRRKLYSILPQLFNLLGRIYTAVYSMLHGQRCEYEADVTGAYFAHQAGYNPLGALYLQELLCRMSRKDFDILNTIHKHFEIAYDVHPYGENRKRALFAAIAEFAPQAFTKRINEGAWKIANTPSTEPFSIHQSYPRLAKEHLMARSAVEV